MATYTESLRVYWQSTKSETLTIEQGAGPFSALLHIHADEIPQLIEMLAEAINYRAERYVNRAGSDDYFDPERK